jgi:hypothetical protein
MKMLLAGIVGGVLLFVWGFLSWVILPIHKTSTHRLPNEETVVAVLRLTVPEKGVYLFPSMTESRSLSNPDKQWEEKYRQGPIGMIFFDPHGMAPFMPLQMINGLIIGMISSALVAWFLARSTAFTASYFTRVAYCGMFGVFLVVGGNLLMWNWFNEPNDWVFGLIIDNIIGWVLAGLAIAAFIKAPKSVTT